MSSPTVLIVEDEPDIAELLEFNLGREGFEVLTASTGEEGLALARRHHPGVILLDLGLPGALQGLEVFRILKTDVQTRQLPVIMLTARCEETDIVVGLEMGADDYIAKPFRIKELIARVRAVLRRSRADTASDEQLRAGEVVIDSARHEVRVSGQPVELTLAEFRLLRALVRSPGRVLSRDRLLNEITDGRAIIIDRNVDVHIRALRRKLGEAAGRIRTVRGVGYKFDAG